MDRLHGATLYMWLHSVPVWLPCRLAAVKRLEISLLAMDYTIIANFFGRLVTVTHLSLCGCTMASGDVFMDLFYSFPHPHYLDLSFTEWESSSTSALSKRSRTTSPKLKLVGLAGPGVDAYKALRWLVSETLHHSIETLFCMGMLWKNVLTLRRISLHL